MSKRDLTVTGYIVRDDKQIKRDELPIEEQKCLATALNDAAMKEAGYIPKRAVNQHNDIRKEVNQ